MRMKNDVVDWRLAAPFLYLNNFGAVFSIQKNFRNSLLFFLYFFI